MLHTESTLSRALLRRLLEPIQRVECSARFYVQLEDTQANEDGVELLPAEDGDSDSKEASGPDDDVKLADLEPSFRFEHARDLAKELRRHPAMRTAIVHVSQREY